MITPYKADDVLMFQCEVRDLIVTLDKIKKVVPSEKQVHMFSDDTGISVLAQEGSSTVCLGLPIKKSSGSGCFTVTTAMLRSIVGGRKTMQFRCKNSVMDFTDGKSYKGSLSIIPMADDSVETLNSIYSGWDDSGQRLPLTIIQEIQKGIAACNINEVFDKTETVPVMRFINIEDGVLTVSAFDHYHMAMYVHEILDKSLSFKIALNDSYFSLIDKTSKGNDRVTLVLTQDVFCLKHDESRLVAILPPIQVDDVGFDVTPRFIRDVLTGESKKLQTSIRVDRDRLLIMATNLAGIHETGSRVQIDVTETQLSVSLGTTYGKARDVIELEGFKGIPCSFMINIQALMEILKLLPASPTNIRMGWAMDDAGNVSGDPVLCVIKPAMKQEYQVTYVMVTI